MENEEFFNIDFQNAEKLGILNLPDNKDTGTEETKEVIDNNNDETKESKEEQIEENSAHQGKEDPKSNEQQEEGSPNISSSIALTLADNGVLQTLDEERLKKITTTEDLVEAFREDVDSRVENQLTDVQKRVNNALNAGVEASRIQQYEQIIKSLDDVTDETLNAEGEQYENYRKYLIYQDYINKGFEEDDAKDMVERSVENGKDIDDAKKALNSLKKFYQKSYSDEIENGKKEQEKYIEKQKKQLKELKDSILNDDDFYTSLEVSKTIREKIYNTVTKPIKQEDGSQLTEIQQYMKNKPNEALKMFGTLYVLTEGFTKFDGIFKGAVKKQVKESNRNLAKLLNQVQNTDGSLNFKSGIGEDSNLKMVDFAF